MEEEDREESPRQNLAEPQDKLVLIVDDDESIVDLLEHVLKREGFRVEKALDGLEALRKVDALSPDLIVLDFMLPGLGGFEILKKLQMGEARAIPILVITGRHLDHKTVDMIRQESNVREFIEKPIRPAVFTGQVHRALGTRPPEIKRSPDRGPLSGNW